MSSRSTPRSCHSSQSDDDERGLHSKEEHHRKTEHTDSLRREHFLKPDSDQIDLDALLDAVLDINDKLEKQENDCGTCNDERTSDDDKREGTVQLKASRKHTENRFMREMLTPDSQKGRQNFSFRNDQVYDIDRENERLLTALTRPRPQSASMLRSQKFPARGYQPPRIKTSSEVNRKRLQRKIEQENEVLLRRLQSVKPDKSLDRDHVMKGQTKSRSASASSRRAIVIPSLSAISSRPSSSRPSSSRPSSSRPTTSSTTYNTRTFSSRDYHSDNIPPDDCISQKSYSACSRKSSTKKRFAQPSWEPGW